MIEQSLGFVSSRGTTLPKSARLLKSKEFKFSKYKKIRTDHFQLIVEKGDRAQLGVSIAKKVLRRSVWRNRVRRLIREAFRQERGRLDNRKIHVIGLASLEADWDKIELGDVKSELLRAVQ